MKHLTLALLLLPAPAAFAQEEVVDDAGVRRAVKYRDREEVDFDRGLELEGELLKPSGALLDEAKRPVFNPLIKLRQDWVDEMRQSVDTVR